MRDNYWYLKPLLFLGFIIKLILSFLCLHTDLINIYHRSYLYWQGEVSLKITRLTAGIQFIHNLWYKFLNFLTNGKLDYLFSTLPHSTPLVFKDLTSGFLWNDFIFSFLLLAKLPYLLADIACLYILYRFFSLRIGLLLWFLNPVIIVSTYIIGRYDVIICFLLLLSFIFLRKKHIFYFSTFVLLAILFRLPMLFFLIFLWIFILNEKNKYGLYFLVIFISSIFTYILPNKVFWIFLISLLILSAIERIPNKIRKDIISSINSPITISISSLIFLGIIIKHRYKIISYLLSFVKLKYLANLKISGIYDDIYIFVVYLIVYFLFLLLINPSFNYRNFLFYSLINILVLYCILYLHPQYFLWGFAFIYVFNWQKLKLPYILKAYLILLFIVAFFMYLMHWDMELYIKSFVLLNPIKLSHIPLLSETYGNTFVFALTSVGRSILVGEILFLLFIIMKNKDKFLNEKTFSI